MNKEIQILAIKSIIREMIVNLHDWNITRVKKALIELGFNEIDCYTIITYPEFCKLHKQSLRKKLQRE